MRWRASRRRATSICYDGEPLTRDELAARVRGKQALVTMFTDRSTPPCSTPARTCKIVANVAVGYNNIDVAAARARGIVVTNTPDVLTEATADLTWALILGITRRLVEGDGWCAAAAGRAGRSTSCWASELRGKQLGIVGFGRIGRAVADARRAFGMRVAYTRGAPATAEAPSAMPLDRLLSTSDVVSLHCPLTPETRHLIDQPALARMKRTRVSGQHVARAGRGRSGAGVGAQEPAHRRRRRSTSTRTSPRCIRTCWRSRTCVLVAAPGQRHDRDAHGHGRPGGAATWSPC